MRYVGENQPVLLDLRIPKQNKPMQLMVLCEVHGGLGPPLSDCPNLQPAWNERGKHNKGVPMY